MGKFIGFVFVILVLFGASTGCSTYNRLVELDQQVGKAYAGVAVAMQRQANLLPNLAETVKGFAGHEKELYTQVSEARAGLTAVAKIKPEDLAKNPELQKQLVEAQTKMDQAFMKVNAVKEKYPELKANTLFVNLMSQIEGAQNRIYIARKGTFNIIEEYNNTVLKLPGRVWASILGFLPKAQFETDDEGKQTPQLSFK